MSGVLLRELDDAPAGDVAAAALLGPELDDAVRRGGDQESGRGRRRGRGLSAAPPPPPPPPPPPADPGDAKATCVTVSRCM